MSIDINIIRESFEKAKPIAVEIADKFYETLWSDFPAAKNLFLDSDMTKQKKSLIHSLIYVVDNIDEPQKLIPYLESMGERHLKYGTKEEHYDWVGSSLLKTFAHFFGQDWTEELKQQWTLAYSFIAETMKEGAKKSIPEIDHVKERAQKICNNLLIDLLNQGIDKEFEEFVRAKVRRVLLNVLEEESEKLLKKAS